jgi:hypothetical protein
LRTVVFYISGHGFGHASRSIEVINALLGLAPDVRVVARASVPKWLFERTVRPARSEGRGFGPGSRFTITSCETDTGAVQIDSLHLDPVRTIKRAREFMSGFCARVDAEATFLRAHNAQLVVSDLPPLGIAAAKKAGLPAVGFGNFTWDWIYSGYADSEDLATQIGQVYSQADVALRLPMHGGFHTFPRIIDVPFVARRSRRPSHETRRALSLPSDRSLILLSFGGYGIERIDQQALLSLNDYAVVGSAHHPLDEQAMYASGFRYEDLVRAVDVVVSKPGYGIISECIAIDTALLYTSRGQFREYDVLVREMPRYVRTQFITHEDLFAGHWRAALDTLLAAQAPPERPRVDGAEVTARHLLDMI